MKNYALSLLLLQHLSLHTLTSAEVHTFKQRDPKDYIGSASNVPDDLGPDDIDVKDDGPLRITFGPELSKNMLETTKKYCKNDPESDDCIKKTQEVMGVGPAANGIQKRVVGIAVAAGGVMLAYGVWKLWTYITDKLEQSMTGEVIHIEIPKEQKEEMTKWDATGDDKFLYKPQNGDAVEVKVNGEQPKPESPGELKKDDNGDITVSLPGKLIPAIEDSWDRSGCGRTGTKRGLEKRVTALDLQRCIQAIIRVGQLGGPAGGIQYIDPTMFPRMTNPLIIEAYDEAKDYSKSMHYGSNAPGKVDENVARFATWMSAAHEIGHFNFRDGKMKMSAAFLKNQKESEDDDEDKDCPKGDDRVFCGNCGGNAKPNDNSRPSSSDSKPKLKLGSCKGFSNGGMKGCECFQDSPRIVDDSITSETQQIAIDLIKNLPDQSDDDEEEKFKYYRSCYKDDEKRMEDHKNWKFLQQTKLDEAIKSFCDGWKKTSGDKKVTTDKEFFGDDDKEWDTVRLTVRELKGGMMTKERCQKHFQTISSCDYDTKDKEKIRQNEFNFKWGGEVQLEDGLFITVQPIHERVYLSDRDLQKGSHRCTRLDGFTITNGGKGKNGKSLSTLSAKQSLTMCVHQMRHVPKNLNVDCAGLLNLKMSRTSYGSKTDCTNNTWKCLTHYVSAGWTAQAKHTPAWAKCQTKFSF